MCGGLWWLWLVGLCLCLVISLLFLLRFLLRLLLRFLATGVAERVLAEGLRAGLGLVAFVGDGFTDVAVDVCGERVDDGEADEAVGPAAWSGSVVGLRTWRPRAS